MSNEAFKEWMEEAVPEARICKGPRIYSCSICGKPMAFAARDIESAEVVELVAKGAGAPYLGLVEEVTQGRLDEIPDCLHVN